MGRWVIGDIHGCFLTFRKLLEETLSFSRDDTVFLLGDMIDRGPRSKETLDYIISLQEQHYNILPIKGNHEDRLVRLYYENRKTIDIFQLLKLNSYLLWLQCGGRSTLESFGAKNFHEIPHHYIQWMESLPYYQVADDFIMVHAGLDFLSGNPFTNIVTMLTCEKMNIIPEMINNKIVIHGHVAFPRRRIHRMIEERHRHHCICLDNGCIHTHKRGFGSLLALNLDTMDLEYQKNID